MALLFLKIGWTIHLRHHYGHLRHQYDIPSRVIRVWGKYTQKNIGGSGLGNDKKVNY